MMDLYQGKDLARSIQDKGGSFAPDTVHTVTLGSVLKSFETQFDWNTPAMRMKLDEIMDCHVADIKRFRGYQMNVPRIFVGRFYLLMKTIRKAHEGRETEDLYARWNEWHQEAGLEAQR